MFNFLYSPLTIKIILIFIVGVIEQFIYSSHIIELNRMKAVSSSLILFLHLNVYLFVVGNMFDDMSKILWTVPIYAGGCAIGNYIIVSIRVYKENLKKQLKKEIKRKK